MTDSAKFVRLFFLILSLIFMVAYTLGREAEPTAVDFAWGLGLGSGAGGIILLIDRLFRRFQLRVLNGAIIGLFVGYLLALALTLVLNAILNVTRITPDHRAIEGIKIFIYLLCTYLGVTMTLRASREWYVSFPFVKLSPSAQKSRDLLLDATALVDPRLIDLANSGLLNKRLVLPRFILRELQDQEMKGESALARRGLAIAKKLESISGLELRYHDSDFGDTSEVNEKVLRLARLIDGEILSGDCTRVQIGQIEGVHVINLHALSHALKPLKQRGEYLQVKIQRVGKEELQGVGYLDDGTMVVVNGGARFIGDTIDVHVLSVKHTSSGRMIFCNVVEECCENLSPEQSDV